MRLGIVLVRCWNVTWKELRGVEGADGAGKIVEFCQKVAALDGRRHSIDGEEQAFEVLP